MKSYLKTLALLTLTLTAIGCKHAPLQPEPSKVTLPPFLKSPPPTPSWRSANPT